MAKAQDASNDAVRAQVAKTAGKDAANTEAQKAAAKPNHPVKHRPETIAKHMADHAASIVGKYVDTPYPDWENSTDSQKAQWVELAKIAQEV